MGQLTKNEVFALAVQRYSDAVYRAAVHNCRCTADAEDVVQEVFVELWHRRDSVTVGEQIQAFLYRAVYTRALNVLKHRDIKNSYEAAMQEVYNKRALFYQPDDNDVLKRIEDRELRKHIVSAIDELPEKCKLVFKLSYLHNMKNKDIAEAMDVSLRTVEAHMYKALKFLRSRLEGYPIIR